MVDYVCSDVKCRKVVPSNLVGRKIRCPFCGSKALSKKQNRVLDVIKAR